MDSVTQPWTVYRIKRMLEKNTLSLKYYLQRPSGQWNRYDKSLWIHTLISDLPKYPIFTRKVDSVYYVLEGKQRIETFIDYINDVYPLSRKTPILVDNDLGEKYKIAGLRFSKLSDSLQRKLTNNQILQYTLNGTDEEIEEFFERVNHGVSLTPQQQAKARMGRKWATTLNELDRHPFFIKKCIYTPAQKRHSDSELSILSYMMLADKHYDIKNFSNGTIAEYAASLRGSVGKEVLITQLKKNLDYLYNSLPYPERDLSRKINLPMLLITAQAAQKMKVPHNIFGEWMKEFKRAMDGFSEDFPTNYRDFGGQGSVKKNKVLGRTKSMLDHFKRYIAAISKEKDDRTHAKAKSKS